VRLPIDDPENTNIDQLPAEDVARINEETNEGSGSDRRIMNGATDFVAEPDPSFPFMDIDKVYNLSLSLKRFDDPDTEGTAGDTIFATVTVIDRATGQQFSFGDYDAVGIMGGGDPDGGFESDSWDYFVMTTGGESVSDDFDWLIDNFTVEVIGSNEPGGVSGDYNSDGRVDAADYVVWRKNNIDGQQGYAIWRANFGRLGGTGVGVSLAAVPEPATAVMLIVACLGLLVARGRPRVI
jgi:hypothetical protein